MPGRVAQSVGHLTRKSVVPGSIPGLATNFRFSFRFFKKGSCQLLANEVLVNRLGDLSLPRKSVVRLTDSPHMTVDVYRGRKTTIQQRQQHQRLIHKIGLCRIFILKYCFFFVFFFCFFFFCFFFVFFFLFFM